MFADIHSVLIWQGRNESQNASIYYDIMGHSEIGVTLNTYTHLGYEDVEVEMQKITVIASRKSTTHRKKCVS